MFRREPSMVKSWSPEEVERYARITKRDSLQVQHRW
ncbi:MAG: hypothetical protein ACLRYY_07830 [Anaerobutyricum soehngenii]